MTLKTREGIFIFRLSGQEVVCIGIGSSNEGKITYVVCALDHAGIGARCNVFLSVWDTNIWRGFCVSVDIFLAPDLTLRSDKPVGSSD